MIWGVATTCSQTAQTDMPQLAIRERRCSGVLETALSLGKLNEWKQPHKLCCIAEGIKSVLMFGLQTRQQRPFLCTQMLHSFIPLHHTHQVLSGEAGLPLCAPAALTQPRPFNKAVSTYKEGSPPKVRKATKVKEQKLVRTIS